MDSEQTGADLDVHKDYIYLCIMRQGDQIIFGRTYVVLT